MTVDEGATLKLEVEIEACPEPTIKWFKNGQEVTADARIKIERDSHRLENYNLTVNLTKGEDSGEYEVRATNEMGNVSCMSKVVIHSKYILRQSIYVIFGNVDISFCNNLLSIYKMFNKNCLPIVKLM